MEDSTNRGSHTVILTPVLYMLLSSAGLGGFGISSLTETITGAEKTAQCASAAKAALEISTQQARYIADLQSRLATQTYDRYTQSDQAKYARAQETRDESQERRLLLVERQLERLGE